MVRGAAAGIVGAAAITATEKAEQAMTNRANSFVPGRTLLALVGRRPPETAKPTLANHAMHWGTGAVVGALRGVWAASGLRGPGASTAHTVVRLATDQTFENATGVGAPPWTWSRQEQAVDLLHKAVYSFATGYLADRWVPATRESRTGTTSH